MASSLPNFSGQSLKSSVQIGGSFRFFARISDQTKCNLRLPICVSHAQTCFNVPKTTAVVTG